MAQGASPPEKAARSEVVERPTGVNGHGQGLSASGSERLAAVERPEQMLRSVVANMPGMVYRAAIDVPWALPYASEAALAITGYEASDFLQGVRSWASVMHADDIGAVAKVLEPPTEAGRGAYRLEYRVLHRDGGTRWVLDCGEVVPGPDGKARWYEGVVLDVTDQRLAEEERRKLAEGRARDEEFQRTFAESPVPAVILDAAGLVLAANDAAARWHGQPAEALAAGRPFEVRLPGEGSGAGQVLAGLPPGPQRVGPLVHRGPRGLRSVELVTHEVTWQGRRARMAVLEDVTERVLAQEGLARSEERYRALVEASAQVVWITGPDGRVEDIPAWRAMTGQTVEEVRGHGWLRAVHPEDQGPTWDAWMAGVREQRPVTLEYRVRMRDGTYRWFASRGVPVPRAGTVREWVGTCTDIEERKRAEAAVAAERARLFSVVEQVPVGVALFRGPGPDYVVEHANHAYARLTGHRGAQGKTIGEVFPPAQRAALQRMLDAAFAGTPHDAPEHPLAQAQGEGEGIPRIGSLAVVPLWTAGRVAGAIAVLADVSEQVAARRSLEEHGRRLQELAEEKNRFLNIAAHELRTPMTPLLMQADALMIEDLPPLQRQRVEMMDRNLRRLNALVEQLLDVARLEGGRVAARKERTDLAKLASEAVETFQAAAERRGVRLRLDAKGGIPVEGDPARLMQVLVNLLSNALKATPEGGLVEVAAAVEGGEAVVQVRDTGAGFPPELAARLFQPFMQLEPFTRGGVGLGLFISRGIVQEHGGTLAGASPGPGRGAAFTIRLPAAR